MPASDAIHAPTEAAPLTRDLTSWCTGDSTSISLQKSRLENRVFFWGLFPSMENFNFSVKFLMQKHFGQERKSSLRCHIRVVVHACSHSPL